MRYSAAIALVAAIPAFVSAEVHMVNVGANGALGFEPASVTAAVGDSVTFMFQSKNHSVVQSTFADPCKRANINGTEGFGSGFQAVEAGAAQMPSFTINITKPDAVWFYCGQKIPVDHCAKGMVGAINAPPDKTIDQFKTKAMSNSSTSASPSTPSAPPASGAMRLTSGAAGLLTLFGLVAGLAL